MKVVQLGPYPPPHGGVQTNLVAIRRLLLERGIACTTINITRFRKPDADEVYYPKNALQVAYLLLKRRYNIIHLHLGGMLKPRELALGLFCCLIPWRKTILTYHSGGFPTSKQGLRARRWTIAGFIFRRFDAVIAVNQAIVRLFQCFGVPSDRIHLIAPHAIPELPQDAALPEDLQKFFDNHRPLLLTVSGLEPEYDLPAQLEVLPRIRKHFPMAGLVIVGAGSMEAELESVIRAHPCGDHILLCGDVPHWATLQAIARADVLLRTTLYDGDSVAVREALHFGTPVLATDNGMRPAGVHLVAVSDANAVYRTLKTLLTQPRPGAAAPAADDQNIEAVLQLYASLNAPARSGRIARAGVIPRT